MNFKTTSVAKAYELLGRERLVLSVIPGHEQTIARKQGELDLETFIESVNQEANNGKPWVPDYTNREESKIEPWFLLKKADTPSGFVFSCTDYVYAGTLTGCGSRFAFYNVAAWRHTMNTPEAIDLFLLTWTKKP